MYPLSANKNLHLHNIRLSELRRSQFPDMSQSHRSAALPKIRMLSRGGRSSSGIRITNIKSIKPPDPEVIKKQEEEKLRAQLQKEIVSRSRNCAFKKYECPEPVVSNNQYCALHITLDPKSGYKQCSHMVNGLRCGMPAPSEKDNALCFEHAHTALHARNRSTAPPPPANTSETLLNQLQHYVRPERARTTSCASSVSVVSDPADQDSMLPHPVDPFKQIDATAINTQYSNAIMECFSGSDSDCDVTDELRGSYEIVQPDEGEVENQPLWRAGVFTAEEAIREARDTLVNLQSAYKRQMDRLKVLLQTERLKYLKALKVEKEQFCSINTQVRTGAITLRERKQLKKLKAFAGYRRRRAVINDKLRLKRLKNDSSTTRAVPSHGRCAFSEYNVRCSNQVLPATKHCMKHILYDRAQVLFTSCNDVRGGFHCREPVARLPLPSAGCRYHTNPPHYTVFTMKKDESDSESLSTSTATEFEQDILDPMALEEAPHEIAPND